MSALTSIAMKSYQPPSSDELKRINSRVISLLQHLSRPNHDENMNVSNENGHTRASQPLYSSRLADKIDEFTQKSLQVLSFAARYDCGLVQSNGFFSFAKLSIRFLQMIENNLQTISSNGQLPYMENVFVRTIDSFLLMAKYMSDQHESIDVDGKANNNHTDRDADQNKTIQFDSQLFVFRTIKMDVDANANQSIKLPLFSVQLSQFQEMIRTASAFQAPQVSLLNHFGVFWLDQSMNNFFNLYSFLIPFYKLNLIDSVRCLWDRKFRLNKYIEFVR